MRYAFPSSQRRGGCAERSEGAAGWSDRHSLDFAELTTPPLRGSPPLRGGECLAPPDRLKKTVVRVVVVFDLEAVA